MYEGPYAVFIEGTSISEKAKDHYKINISQTEYLPGICTIKPTPDLFSCSATDAFWKGLIAISEVSAEPELFSHVFIYRDKKPVLEWWDSFAEPMFLSSDIARRKRSERPRGEAVSQSRTNAGEKWLTLK